MVLLLLALLIVLVPHASSAPTGGTAVAFVAAQTDDRLVAVDVTTSRVVARIPVPDGPHNVTVDGGLRWVLVTSPRAGAVTLVDAYSLRVVKVFRGFGNPHDVAVEGDRAYVTDGKRGQLIVIDLLARRVVRRIAVGANPHDVAVGDVALVTHRPKHPEVTLVEVGLGRRRVLRELPVGGPAQDISEQPDSANAYVTYWGSGAVGAVDWGRGQVLWRRKLGALVDHVQFDPFRGWRLWATDHRTGRTYLLSARNGRVLRTLDGCRGAGHIAFGGTAWVVVACQEIDALAVYRTGSWRRSLVPSGGGTHGVAVALVP